MPGRDQHLLRRAAAVRTGPAEIVGFDHRDRHSSAPDGTGNANAGVAAAEDHHVECLDAHQIYLVYWRLQAIRTEGRLEGFTLAWWRCYLVVIAEVIEPT